MLAFLIFGMAICSLTAAPTDGPIRIPIDIPGANLGFLDSVSERVNTYSKTALMNAAAINGLVTENLATASDRLNSGIAATANGVKEQFQSASSAVTRGLESAGQIASKASTVIYNTAATGAQALYDGAEVGVNQKVAALRGASAAVGNLVPSSGIFSEQPRKINKAILEQESTLSRAQSAKENIQHALGGFFQARPIVDTIREEEKYGNTGGKFDGVGRALVSTSESIASVLSNAINAPFDYFKSITRSASSSLNNLGSRLVGL